MAFALATGRHIQELQHNSVVEQLGYGPVARLCGHPHWLLVADALSPIETCPYPGSPWRIAFDGYLGNAQEIITSLPERELLRRATHGALVAALLDALGPSALYRLLGNFALVAANASDGSLIAMRDRMGGRTLYRLDEQADDLLIASRSAWVQVLGRQSFAPDPLFLSSFFALQKAPPPGHSAFCGVREFLPGEQLRVLDGRKSTQRPALSLEPDFDYKTPGDCIARFAELFEQAVAACLPPSGDVACMLSGGLDSGPCAVIADRLLAAEQRKLLAISWRLDQFPECCEAEWIVLAGTALRTSPLTFNASALLPFSEPGTSMLDPDAPHYNGFRAAVMQCYERASQQGCRVILNGNAGDELYPPPHLLNLDRVQRRHWGAIWREVLSLWAEGGFSALARWPALRHPMHRVLRAWRPAQALPPPWLSERARSSWTPSKTWPDELAGTRFPEYACQLFGAPMAFGRAHESAFPNRSGLDRRDPFHDERLARFMLHAPFSLSYRGRTSKWVMRQATRGVLPEALRWKDRTGLLDTFWEAGLVRNMSAVKGLLFSQQANWQEYITPACIEALLEKRESVAPGILVQQCLGYVLWNHHWAEQPSYTQCKSRHTIHETREI